MGGTTIKRLAAGCTQERRANLRIVGTIHGGRAKNPITCKTDYQLLSLQHVLANCTDFQEEDTSLQ
jgi:hypothetical protein